MTENVRNVIIIGSGCSGLTAAIYAARANLKPLVIEGHEPEASWPSPPSLKIFPGFPMASRVPNSSTTCASRRARFGAEFKTGHVVSVDLSQKTDGLGAKPIEVNLGRETLLTRALIIASGASARWLGLPNEKALIGHGVSSCATCDGFFFSGKEIAVIGGGDSAMEEAIFLTRFASKVTLIHRRSEFRASKIMLDRARANEKIEFLTDTVVDDVYDVNKKEVTGLRLRNTKDWRAVGFPHQRHVPRHRPHSERRFRRRSAPARWRRLHCFLPMDTSAPSARRFHLRRRG